MARKGDEDTRRQYGTGTVFERPDGKWVGRVEAGWTAAGTRRRIQVTGATEAEAKRLLRDKQRAVEDGNTAPTTRATVKSWSTEWLKIRQTRVDPLTVRAQRVAVRRYIVPAIGHRRLSDLRPADVRAVHNAVRDQGLSSTTARGAHAALSKMLKDAQADGHSIPHQVFAVPSPVAAVHDRQAMSTDEAVAILDVASKRPDASRWVAALLQGMRQGEVLGLTWDRVDFDRGIIDVSWQLQELQYREDAPGEFTYPDGYHARHLYKRYHLVGPKSRAGKRVIPMTDWFRSALLQWREIAPENEWSLVWPQVRAERQPVPRGGKARRGAPGIALPRPVTYDRREWRELQAEADVSHPAGRPYKVHEARHTTATLLLEANVDPVVITAILGHSSILTTHSYQRVTSDFARQALETIGGRLGLGSLEGAGA